LNPPYSAGNIDRFMQKAYEESQKGAVVVCLVPCATDTRWWHNYAMRAQEIRFIKGRVRFIGYDEKGEQIKNSPTFSSCVVIFRPSEGLIPRGYPWIGKTIEQPRSVKA
jgi:site-specific DNA-methyltransferase (adenine-specific)